MSNKCRAKDAKIQRKIREQNGIQWWNYYGYLFLFQFPVRNARRRCDKIINFQRRWGIAKINSELANGRHSNERRNNHLKLIILKENN